MRGVLLALLILAGDTAAAKTFRLEISAESSSQADSNRRFVLISLLPAGVAESVDADLADELTAQLQRGLSAAGFVPVNAAEEADIAISFEYGFGTPRIDIPTDIFSIAALATPRSRRIVEADFPFFLDLVAYDLKAYLENDEAIRLWRTVVTGSTKDPDLATQLAVMLAGATDMFGKEIEGIHVARVSDLSRMALYIRGERESP